MQAGRELDSVIAEKVMGWDWEAPAQVWWGKSDIGTWEPKELPHYSTSIADAWELIDKLKDHFGRVGFYHGKEGVQVFRWIGNDMTNVEELGFGETVPHAICLAALKAKGVL